MVSDELKMSACKPAPGGNRSRNCLFTFTPKQFPHRNAALSPSSSSLPFPSCSFSHSSHQTTAFDLSPILYVACTSQTVYGGKEEG